MSMLDCFFSVNYSDRGDLFEGMSIWQDDLYKKLQGTYPVINLSFANVKEQNYVATREKICGMIADLYNKYNYLLNSTMLTESDKAYINETIVKKERMSDACAGSRAQCTLRTPGSEAAWQSSQPERFYHGFVLGLIVELSEKYIITSNRESGFGRYDVVIEPKDRYASTVLPLRGRRC